MRQTSSFSRTRAWIAGACCACFLAVLAALPAAEPPRNLGRFAKWACVEVLLQGPASRGRGDPNPFAILVDLEFTSPAEHTFRVPGFYDGDGKGGLDGDVWKARFSADETGRWIFVSKSSQPLLDGVRGGFEVTPTPAAAPGFYRWGRLEYTGTPANRIRYLKFRDGPYWLKAGCDDPENFLGSYRNYDTRAKRRRAVDYLAARGVNSLYIMTHNIGGDDNDVWPWLGATPADAKRNAGAGARFDTARLEAWREIFERMQRKGVVPYIVLEDDSAWKGYDHARYYREIAARFAYLPALLFNLNEEYNENYRFKEAISLLRTLRSFDPYGHPCGIHNVNEPRDGYVDAPEVSFTSIQTNEKDPLAHNQRAVDWIRRCVARKRRVLMVGFDEGRPERDRRGWWSAYLGGGVWEVHVKSPYDRPPEAWEPAWTQLGGARAFMESLPFQEMEPRNDLVKSGSAFCLARPGKTYALYLPRGGTVELELAPGASYACAWWKAANGRDGRFVEGPPVRGGLRTFRAPGPGDWALRIRRQARSTKP